MMEKTIDLDKLFSTTLDKSGGVRVEGKDGTRFTITSSGSLSVDPSTFFTEAFKSVQKKVSERTLKKAS